MKRDQDKTKEQLINELLEIRQRAVQLETHESEYKRLVETLRESEEKYRILVEDALIGIMNVDITGKITYVNKTILQGTGYSWEELIDKNVFRLGLFSGETIRVLRKRVKERLMGQPPGLLELQFKRKDGEWMWLQIRGRVLRKHNMPIGIQIIGDDITERKQAEEEFIRLSNAVRMTTDSIVISNLEAKIIDVNEATLKMYGTDDKRDLIGMNSLELISPEEREVALNGMREVLEKGYVKDREYHIITKDGSKVLMEMNVALIRGVDGEPVGFVGVSRDITERKQAKEALTEERNKAQGYLNIAGAILVAIDTDQKVSLINKKGCEVLGYKEEEIIGKNWFDNFLAERVRDEVKAVFNKLVAGEIEPVEYFENPVLAKSGEERTIAWHNSVLRDEMDNITGILSSGEDITERKRAEEALRESEDKYRKLFELGSDALFLIEVETGRILDLNDTALKMYGYSREEALQMKNTDFSAEPAQTRQATVKHEQQIPVRYHKKKDGPIFPTDISVAYFAWYGKEVCIAAIREITERKKLEEERQRAARLESVGTLAGGIAHDFNNILTGIMGNIGLARRYVEPKSKAEERLLEAEKASLRAKDLTQQLLTFARGGAPIKTTVSIAELIQDSATFALRGSNVRCEFSLADNLWSAEVDEGQINQVITNLVINADEAMPEGGILNIGAKNRVVKPRNTLPLPEGNYVEITIEDHGVGISREHLSKIFDPYFTTKQKGSGLGLSTAYSIVKNHGGYITAKSKLGVGTTYHIYLPASEKPIPVEKEVVAETRIAGKGRVLVMDDEEVIRALLHDELTDIGYEVELTVDGAEAIEQYTRAKESGQPFDAVILDLTVPGGMGGREVIRKLLEIDPNVKAIVSSGYSTDPIMSKFRDYGFIGVVAKPYKMEQLEKTLHSILRETGE